jgi:hypothetical protein
VLVLGHLPRPGLGGKLQAVVSSKSALTADALDRIMQLPYSLERHEDGAVDKERRLLRGHCPMEALAMPARSATLSRSHSVGSEQGKNGRKPRVFTWLSASPLGDASLPGIGARNSIKYRELSPVGAAGTAILPLIPSIVSGLQGH